MKIKRYLGLGLAIALTWSSTAHARSQTAGIGYTPAKDGTYCSTVLTAQDPNAQINLREGPGTNYKIRHYGFAGDRIDFLSQNGNPDNWAQGTDRTGQVWYQVGFPTSRAYGWVREDFVQLPPTECRN